MHIRKRALLKPFDGVVTRVRKHERGHALVTYKLSKHVKGLGSGAGATLL